MDTFFEIVGIGACVGAAMAAVAFAIKKTVDWELGDLPSQILRKRVDDLEQSLGEVDDGYGLLSKRLAKLEFAALHPAPKRKAH